MNNNEMYQRVKKLTKENKLDSNQIAMQLNIPFKRVLHYRNLRPKKTMQEDGSMKRVLKG